MADCSYARCMQERRTIKKHLQKWTKNCIYTLGFERVAEEFMGRRKWKVYQERVLRSWCPSIEREIEIKDWDPSEDKCSFCDLEPTGKVTDEEPGSPLRPDCYGSTGHSSSHNNNNNHIELLEGDESDSNSVSSTEDSIPTMNALDSVTACQAAIAVLTGSGGAPNPLLYPPGVFPSWYLPQPPKPLLEGLAKSEPPVGMNLPAPAASEMPLDLSAKSSKLPPATASPDGVRLPSLMDSKPAIKGRSRMSPMTGRRAYTEDELQAALRDIQSGKLGTRRAAVIYGIPRSTLRNKVYKLALERERDAHLLLAPRLSPPDEVASSPSLPTNPEKEDSSAEEERDPEAIKSRFSVEDLVRMSVVDGCPPAEGLGALLHTISRLQAEGVSAKDAFPSENSVLGTYLAQLLKLKENVSPNDKRDKALAKEEPKNDADRSKSTTCDPGPGGNDKLRYSSHVLSEMMRHIMTEQRLLVEEQQKRKAAGGENGIDDDQANVILRIPSFKPNATCSGKGNACDPESRYAASPAGASHENSRHGLASPSVNGDAETSSPSGKPSAAAVPGSRDAAVQKFHQEGVGVGIGLAASAPGQDGSGSDASATRGAFPQLSLPHQHSVLKNHFDRNQHRGQHVVGGQSNSQGKGTRPKRGKYRNYDRDSLVEAVRAVQRGEMSVHRAGSYYGVPHSTLEYKVKERHLMRPRKREPKGEDKSKMSLPSGAAAGSAADKPKQVPLAPKPTTVTKSQFPNPGTMAANGLKIPPGLFDPGVSPLAAYAGTHFPFWPPNPFHPLPLDISRRPFVSASDQLFSPQIMQGNVEASPSPSALPPTARRIAESLYDGSGNNGSFLDGIIRSSLETGLPASGNGKHDGRDSHRSSSKALSNKTLLDQLCRNSRLTPVPKSSGGGDHSDDDNPQRSVPYDLSRSSDDEEDDDADAEADDDDEDDEDDDDGGGGDEDEDDEEDEKRRKRRKSSDTLEAAQDASGKERRTNSADGPEKHASDRLANDEADSGGGGVIVDEEEGDGGSSDRSAPSGENSRMRAASDEGDPARMAPASAAADASHGSAGDADLDGRDDGRHS